jgi:hypothetical protein
LGFAVKARQLIAGASYGPATLKVVGQAFDGAWAEIADHFHDPLETEAARLRLANTVLELVKQAGQDPGVLKAMALRVMVLTYRRLRDPGQPASTEAPPGRD